MEADKREDRVRSELALQASERMLLVGAAAIAIGIGLWDYRAGVVAAGAFLFVGGLVGMRNHAG